MTCPRCRAENPVGARFCEECGACFDVTCPSCGEVVTVGKKFCRSCGAALEASRLEHASPASYTPKHLADKILTSRAALEGERKTVTVLFCDIASSTTLAERLGPEKMHALLNQFFEVALAEVHRYEGTINQFLGDGFMALFGAPVAHEDHARRAILAALAVQRALREGREALAEAEARRIDVRMGLNTGMVVVGKIGDDLRMDYTAVGDATHLAARLQHLAEPGAIYLSETTHGLVEAYVESEFLGVREVKGLAPQRLYRIEGLKPRATRFDLALHRGLSPLVGRRQELAALERAHREAKAGALRVVNLVGEAGIGKSRLLYEFRQRLAGERVFFLEGHCASFGRGTPFLPFVEVVRNAFRLDERDTPAEMARKLQRGLELLGVEVEGPLPFLLNLLGLDPGKDAFQGLDGEIIGARTRDTLAELLRARCRLSPVVLALDDLHWSDRASEELLLRVIQTLEPLPLLILCAFRPEYRPPWARRERATEIVLQPLSDEYCTELVQRRLSSDRLPEEPTRLIVDKAEGNPLFAEELIRYLVETGRLVRPEQDVATLSLGTGTGVPGTVRDLIMARVDRLSEGHRTILQVASAIGRRFSPELVQAVAGNGNLSRYLTDLASQELIFHQEAGGRQEYLFKHALIQEAIYDSLLTTRRAELHERLAEAIEQSYGDRLGEWAEVLAHHWSGTPRVDRTVRYLALAGEKSLRVYALDEAHERFRRGVELIETVPGCADDAFLVDVLMNWARVYYYRKDYRGLTSLVERYLPRAEALADSRRLSLLLFWLGFSLFSMARDSAGPFLERALALGETLGDEECIGYACMGLMYAYWATPAGRPRDIVDRLGERGLAIGRSLGDVFLQAKCLVALVWHLTSQSRFNDARAVATRLSELGRSASDPRTAAMGLYALATVELYEERFREGFESAEKSLGLSPDPVDFLMALWVKGACLALQGQAEEGLKILSEARRQMAAGEFYALLKGLEIPYGVAVVLAGRIGPGVRCIENAIRQFAKSGWDYGPAWGHLILGDIHLQMALGEQKVPLRVLVQNLGFVARTLPVASRTARWHFHEAIRVAREIGMPGVLARALLGLGLLDKAKRRPEEARKHLEEALRVAEPHSLTLTAKIRQALASLP